MLQNLSGFVRHGGFPIDFCQDFIESHYGVAPSEGSDLQGLAPLLHAHLKNAERRTANEEAEAGVFAYDDLRLLR